MGRRLPAPAVGQRFGHLTVVEPETRHKGYRAALCICDCGQLKAVYFSRLYRQEVNSCGCLRSTQQGFADSPEYRSWQGMVSRCCKPNNKRWRDYGGRGVIVCERWLGADGFQSFLADMGPKPSPDHSIDKDINGNGMLYSPETCCWATREQQANHKRNNRLETAHGKTQTISQWARELGLTASTVI